MDYQKNEENNQIASLQGGQSSAASNNFDEEIIYAAFNQDQQCFACGTQSGFKIFNTLPFKHSHKRKLDGGIGIVEMMFRTNILALVGGGQRPKFAPTKVFLWDDLSFKCIGELSFKTQVRAVKLTKEKIVVVLENKTFIYNFEELRLIDAIDTCQNLKGIVALNPDPDNSVLATPATKKGCVHLRVYEKNRQLELIAHDNALQALSLNYSGTILATASEKGTIIRIHSTETGSLLQELRRGSKQAEIFSLCFDKQSQRLACSSDKSTIHVFTVQLNYQEQKAEEDQRLEQEIEQNDQLPPNKKNFLQKIFTNVVEKSSVKWRIPTDGAQKTICGFNQDGTNLIVISQDGNYYQVDISGKEGNCKVISQKSLK